MPREPLTESAPRRRLPFVIAALAAVSLLLAGCGRGTPGEAQGPGAGAPPPPLPVTVLGMQPRKVPIALEAVARTEGSREVEVRARVAGILEKQLFREGESIRAGAPMYRIERAPFEIALAQARAALAEVQARADRAQLEARRLHKLLADRAISQREYDDAQSSQQQTQAVLLAARARVREAELNLSYTAVDAPISGIAGRALRSEGSLVTPGGDSALLVTLTRTDPIWVRFALSESEYAQLRSVDERAAKVVLTLPDGKRHEGAGRLNFTGSTVDPRLGTVQMRAEFANPSLALLPGQYLKVRLEIGEREAFVVPQTAVVQTDRGRFVWVVDASNQANLRPVQTGGWFGRDWVVHEGLRGGDRVAIDNLLRLRPGATVQPRSQSEAQSEAQAGGAGAGPGGPR